MEELLGVYGEKSRKITFFELSLLQCTLFFFLSILCVLLKVDTEYYVTSFFFLL